MKKTIYVIFVFVFFVISCLGQSVNDFVFTTENGGITITGYNKSLKNVRIPEKINGLPVVAIGNRAFDNTWLEFNHNLLTSITLPKSITYIGDGAFDGSRLTNVVLPDNVNIQPDSFYFSLYDKYIKNGKKRTSFNFSYSTANDFFIMILDGSVVEIIGYKEGVKDVIIPEEINGLPVVAIGGRVFWWLLDENKITSITMPDSIAYIGGNTFADNRLTNITLPNFIAYIGDNAFSGNQLISITIGANVDLQTNSFDNEFPAFYDENGKKAGVYTYNRNIWSYSAW